ncbi:hypothetical protein VOLCADRAFT_99056 [Volvox carteri f. nagariensis]|uniref:Uncharacterized protein n=1 Tax=Volvox carteri f. nagariensis TaxID=3068 RepID=D8UGY0_VOLCA|nr:uncharacterized protein VOLCADRAFT_99056 [Volvox carteri f. nagariensis]EFJ41059.1 hypothetical protein VOLCADRAFT_99056 [Volvox carteri f. nagariensis]|eukprot:XP_002957923.1 hypothetical protein VOLCADRAFT_99056 [Volvox carteri f. nagariensis]
MPQVPAAGLRQPLLDAQRSPPPSPLPPPLHENVMRLEASFLALPAALAAELPNGVTSSAVAAARMDAVRHLAAAPDVRTMREVSEELAARAAPPGSSSAPAPAAGGAGDGKPPNMKARLQAPDLALLLGMSPAEAKALIASQRELGRLTRGSATQSIEMLGQLLGLFGTGSGAGAGGVGGFGGEGDVRQRQLGRLVVRQPRVLLVSAPELRERFVELQSLLSLPTSLARRVVASQPGLLTHSPDVLRSRLSGLCSVFNTDPSLVAVLATHHPGLLAVNGGELSGRAAALTEELRLTKQQAVAVFRRQPRALLLPSETMRTRLRNTARLLGLPGGGALGRVVLNAPRLLLSEEAEVERRLKELAVLLQIPADRAAVVASEHPVLLVTPGSVLEERLRTLAELAQLNMSKARALAVDKPSLLTKSSASMRRSVAEAEAAEEGEGGGEGRVPGEGFNKGSSTEVQRDHRNRR